jgi:hypothetical protein
MTPVQGAKQSGIVDNYDGNKVGPDLAAGNPLPIVDTQYK